MTPGKLGVIESEPQMAKAKEIAEVEPPIIDSPEPILDQEVSVLENPVDELVAGPQPDPVTGLTAEPELDEIHVEDTREIVKVEGYIYIPVEDLTKVLFVEKTFTYQLDPIMGRPRGEFVLRTVKV
jgi:hypothetical protein